MTMVFGDRRYRASRGTQPVARGQERGVHHVGAESRDLIEWRRLDAVLARAELARIPARTAAPDLEPARAFDLDALYTGGPAAIGRRRPSLDYLTTRPRV